MGLNHRSRSAAGTFGGIVAGFALQRKPSPQAASKVQLWPSFGPPAKEWSTVKLLPSVPIPKIVPRLSLPPPPVMP